MTRCLYASCTSPATPGYATCPSCRWLLRDAAGTATPTKPRAPRRMPKERYRRARPISRR